MSVTCHVLKWLKSGFVSCTILMRLLIATSVLVSNWPSFTELDGVVFMITWGDFSLIAQNKILLAIGKIVHLSKWFRYKNAFSFASSSRRRMIGFVFECSIKWIRASVSQTYSIDLLSVTKSLACGQVCLFKIRTWCLFDIFVLVSCCTTVMPFKTHSLRQNS